MKPFVSFFTPTFKRPQRLARCLASVSAQTAVQHLEQIVLPDHVGLGVVDGLFGRLPQYATACHGRYVHVLADDDVLAAPDVVERLMAFAETQDHPPVIVVEVIKRINGEPMRLPAYRGEPQEGLFDMACLVLRRDVFLAHVHDYGRRYAGDADHAQIVWHSGYRWTWAPILFVEGEAMKGAPE